MYLQFVFVCGLAVFLDMAASSVNVKDVTICINLRCVRARRFVVRRCFVCIRRCCVLCKWCRV